MAREKNWGDEIVDAIANAIEGNDYNRLNEQIRRTMDDAVNSAGRRTASTNTAPRRQTSREYTAPLYKNKSKFLPMAGAIFCGLVTVGGAMTISSMSDFGFTAAFALFTALCVGRISLINRFRTYKSAIGNKRYVEVDRLARVSGRDMSAVVRDLRKMISKGWFRQGHLDDKCSTLMLDHTTYDEYLSLEKQRKALEKEEEEKLKEEQRKIYEPTDNEIVNRGREFVEEIHRCNDAIPGEEISAKIKTMEDIVTSIFDRIEDYPDMVDQVRKLLDYYLPTTVKLLHAYEELDETGIELENVATSKRQIEESLDSLNDGFQKLLDTLFESQAWDVSSDISVLNTMMAQDGLSDNDF